MDNNPKKRERERIREIISVFLKHGIRDGIKAVNDPEKVRMALEDLGPTFIKIGQILSTRHDILPSAFIKEFKKLQDETTPQPFDTVRKTAEDELGQPLVEVFSSFDREPFASASLAQVHKACLKTGEEVAVKILRRGIRKTILTDIALLKRLIFFMKLTLQGQVIDPKELIEDLEESVKNELDFSHEAANMKKFKVNSREVKYITSPRLYEELSTSALLVQQFIRGIKIDKAEELLQEGYILDDIGTKLAYNYLYQVFDDGFFHADPHPGNLIISAGTIVYLDFGMMGTLSEKLKSHLFRFLQSVASRNIEGISSALLSVAIKKGPFDYRKFYADVEELFNTYIDMSLDEINLPFLMERVFKVCRSHRLAIPREAVMLMKGLLTIESLISGMSPELKIMDIAVPYVRSRMLERKNLERMVHENIDSLMNFFSSVLKLPSKASQTLNSLLAGRLTIRMEHSLESSVNQINRMVNRLIIAIVIAALIIGSSVLINADTGPKINDVPAIGLVGYVGAGLMGLWLIISILRSGKI